MSRFLIACSLVAVFFSTVLATTAMARSVAAPTPQFARPPVSEVHPTEVAVTPVRVVDRAAVRAKLLEQRATNVARFRAYVQRGVFPSNTYRDGKLNVWIDEASNLCAAATMISDSGLGDLVMRVGQRTNFIRLRDVSRGPLMDWMLMSGLTQAEIVAIQEPGFNVQQRDPDSTMGPIVVDAELRAAENLRLERRYQQVDAMIERNAKRSIEAAVDRLMKNRALASKLVNS